MKERELSIGVDENPAIVDLGESKSEVIEALKNIGLCAHTMLGRIESDELDEGYKNVMVQIMEYKIVDVAKLTGFDSHLAKEQDDRYAQIRSLNMENRELRKQLGMKVSMEDVRERVKIIADSFKAWCQENGLWCREVMITGYSLDAEISSSSRDKPDILEGAGIKVVREGRSSWDISASKENIENLMTIINKSFPSATFTDMKTWIGRNGNFTLRGLELRIRDLNDFEL